MESGALIPSSVIITHVGADPMAVMPTQNSIGPTETLYGRAHVSAPEPAQGADFRADTQVRPCKSTP